MLKRGLATQAVAKELMKLDAGEKIPTITEFSSLLNVSRGNVQYALNRLKDSESIDIKSRGHLGSFLLEIDYLKLAEFCGVRSLVGVMPLPYSRRYEGLATGIYSMLNRGIISGNMAFMRGSINRFNALMDDRYDFAVMSALAYEQKQAEHRNLHCAVNFGPNTYVKSHVVMTPNDFDLSWTGKKVAIDTSSVDQSLLTHLYFADKDVEFVPMVYNQIMPGLQSGLIDAAVWNSDDMDLTGSIVARELQDKDLGTRDTQAVLVCKAEDSITIRLLEQTIDPEEVCKIQREVLNMTRIPWY